MWHATCTYEIQNNFQLFVIGSQIDTLIPSPSFGHNLCFRYSNGSYKPNLNIYILRTFQWYKELFNPMNFDPSNCFLKIREFIRTLTPKVEVHLGVCGPIPSHSIALLGVWVWLPCYIFGLHLSMPFPWSWTQG
jgi:hypothetical protein